MKININQQELVNAISIAQRAVSSRTTMQVLTGILFEAKDGKLKLSSTDFDISIKTSVDCTVIEEGAIVINSQLFGNIARKLPQSEVEIISKDNKASIRCENIKYDLTGMDKNDFPSLPEVKTESNLQLDVVSFVKAVKSTIFCASIDDTIAVFMGVQIETDHDGINFVATDRYRLSRVKLNGSPSIKLNSVVPHRSLQELIKIIDQDTDVKISTSGGQMLFEFGNTKFYTKLIEGKFVDYKSMLGREKYESYFTVDKASLINSLERISILATEDKARLIKIQILDEQMNLTSNTEIGNGFETVRINKIGDDLKIAFNNKYLLEGIKAMDAGEVKINYKGDVNPVTIEPIEENFTFTYLVLPVKLNSEAF